MTVLKAISFIKEDPFCEQRYEGELLGLVYKLDVCHYKKYKTEIKQILEREEFSNLILSFLKKIQEE